MNGSRDRYKERLVADLKHVMTDVDDLLRATGGPAGDQADELRDRLQARVRQAQRTLSDLEGDVLEQARAAAKVADDYVRDHRWVAVGAAAGVGLLVGLLLQHRR